MKNTKNLIMLLLFMLFLFTGNVSFAENIKTIIIVTDELDFSAIEKLNLNNEMSLGLMNTRTSNVFNNNSESYFMTIATGRRVEISEGLFKSLEIDQEGTLFINGYENIIEELDNYYKDFSKNMDFLSDSLKEKDISIGYLGNDISALIAADRNGKIYNGFKEIHYNSQWLFTKTSSMLENSDVLVISFNIDKKDDRIEILKDYIEKCSMHNIMIFPRKISGDIDDIRNSTLVPIIYTNQNENYGILTSPSTNRQGLITNMDIFSEITSIYGISSNTATGHSIESSPCENFEELIKINRNNLNSILNLIVIKYIFHGLIICVQIYIIYNILRKKKYNKKYKMLINGMLIMIFLSLILGITNLSQNVFLYSILLVSLTIAATYIMEKKNFDILSIIPILTNIALLLAVFFYPDVIYKSFYGFNNVVSGGRFFGLNNESMAILIVTGIITCFTIKNRINNEILSSLAVLLYFPIIILALSERYASNFGGYLTSIITYIILLYIIIFSGRISKKTIITLLITGTFIFLLGFSIKIGNTSVGHARSLFMRINALGIYELFDMIVKKLKQLFLIAILPPWSIIIIAQLYFIKRFFTEEKNIVIKERKHDKYFTAQIITILISSILAFTLNDTGAIALAYMNTYVVAKIVDLYCKYHTNTI